VQASGSIRLSDVQQLLLWTLADGVSPKWAFIQARALRGACDALEHIRRVVLRAQQGTAVFAHVVCFHEWYRRGACRFLALPRMSEHSAKFLLRRCFGALYCAEGC